MIMLEEFIDPTLQIHHGDLYYPADERRRRSRAQRRRDRLLEQLKMRDLFRRGKR